MTRKATNREYPPKTIRLLLESWAQVALATRPDLVVMKADLELAIARLSPPLRATVQAVQLLGDEAVTGVTYWLGDDEVVGPTAVTAQEYSAAVEVLYHLLNVEGIGARVHGPTGHHHCYFGKVRQRQDDRRPAAAAA